MTTITAIDYRRTDQRTHTWLNPYWISSAVISAVDSDDLGAILFSFPTAGRLYIVEQVVVHVLVACTASTTFDLGSGTLATDAVTSEGDITIVDLDEYFKTADFAVTLGGQLGSTTGNTSDWLAAKILGSWVAPYIITGAATTVPCVYATITNSGAISAGSIRVHMLITEVPPN